MDGPVSPASNAVEIAGSVKDAISVRFAELDVKSVSVSRLDVPDVELYLEAKGQYSRVIETRTQTLEAAARDLAAQESAVNVGLDRLERYGEILERYPVLLDYFSLSQEYPNNPLDLEALIPPTAQ
jgi:hypothetical protein